MLACADEIGRELSGSEPSTFPFRHCFAFLLITFFHHQIHRFFFAHIPGVNALIENSIANRAESHLQLLHLDLGSAVSLFRHRLFAIDSPALDEWSALKN